MRLIFDHVPKTGGLALAQALRMALPEGTLSPHLHPYENSVPPAEYSRWHHLAGHFGSAYRSALPDFTERLTATVIREPVSRATSVYTFWRYTVPREHSRKVALAHDLSFSDFIRHSDAADFLLDGQTRFLGGNILAGGDTSQRARDILSDYRVVGVLDQLESVLDAILAALRRRRWGRASKLLAKVNRNESKQRIEISAADRSYLIDAQPFDLALYDEACRRSLQRSRGYRFLVGYPLIGRR